jgi:hypothetical protein
MTKTDRVKMFNPVTQTFAQYLALLRMYFIAENILEEQRQEAFLHVHCLSPAQQRHVTNAAAAMIPPVDVPLPLDRVAEIMLTMGSQMLRSPAFLRRDLRKLRDDGRDISGHNDRFIASLAPILSEEVPMAMQDQILAYIDSIPASIMEHLPVDPVTQRPWNNLDTLMVAVENRAAVMITAHPTVFNTKAGTVAQNTNQAPSQATVHRSNKKARNNSTKPYSSTINKPATSSFTTATFKSPCRWCVRLGVPGDNMHLGQACKKQSGKQRYSPC